MCKRPVLKFFFWIGMLLITSHFLWHFYVKHFGCCSWQCRKVLFYFRRHISSLVISQEIHTWKKNKLSVRSKIVLPKEVLKWRCHHAWMKVAIVNFAREKIFCDSLLSSRCSLCWLKICFLQRLGQFVFTAEIAFLWVENCVCCGSVFLNSFCCIHLWGFTSWLPYST